MKLGDGKVKFEESYWRLVQQQLARLTDAGLTLTEPMERYANIGDDHEFGFYVQKPREVKGNSLPNTEVWLGNELRDERKTDAPVVMLETDNGQWVVRCGGSFTPGPGPGDFRHVYDRLDEAVGDVLDFYFGDAARAQAIWKNEGMG